MIFSWFGVFLFSDFTIDIIEQMFYIVDVKTPRAYKMQKNVAKSPRM